MDQGVRRDTHVSKVEVCRRDGAIDSRNHYGKGGKTSQDSLRKFKSKDSRTKYCLLACGDSIYYANMSMSCGSEGHKTWLFLIPYSESSR